LGRNIFKNAKRRNIAEAPKLLIQPIADLPKTANGPVNNVPGCHPALLPERFRPFLLRVMRESRNYYYTAAQCRLYPFQFLPSALLVSHDQQDDAADHRNCSNNRHKLKRFRLLSCHVDGTDINVFVFILLLIFDSDCKWPAND